LVVAGRVQVHRGGRLISELREGECFGEMALLDPAPRSATVTALEHLLALRIYQEDFYDLLAERPAAMQGILKVLVRRLRKAIE
jgi:CRP-like cAMP-binding protein